MHNIYSFLGPVTYTYGEWIEIVHGGSKHLNECERVEKGKIEQYETKHRT